MEIPNVQKLLISIENIIKDFEKGKSSRQGSNQDLGTIYTPTKIVDYIVSNIFRIYFDDLVKIQRFYDDSTYRSALIKNDKLSNKLLKKIQDLRILDPACGSGRFLVSAARNVFKLFKSLDLKLTDFEIKRNIIEKNLYGIEIEKPACIISKLQLVKWLLSDKNLPSNFINLNTNTLNTKDINHFINKLNLKLNIFHKDFLLDVNSSNYDIIIGNPPYIENKKIKNDIYKKKLTKRFKSAFRLFDLSIIFLERALELLKQGSGCLSMIITNKILSADYGKKIRHLLINETEFKEIINISSIPLFDKIAAYPVILTFLKKPPNDDNLILIKTYVKLNELVENGKFEIKILPQKLVARIPGHVFPIFGNINLIKNLYTNFKPFSDVVQDLKIIYRPFGFINWAKSLDNLTDIKQSNEDLLLIGTGNVGKYHIKFDKPIRIAKKNLKISFFPFQNEFGQVWEELKSEKLIFREIARELTCVYDKGLFVNVTGLYFIRIPSFNEEKLLSLLVILNSSLMDSVFKTLFGSLHMSGGYLRFNGSFIKRLPMPERFPLILSQIGKILQFLSQLQYDLNTFHNDNLKNSDKISFDEKIYKDLDPYFNFFKDLSDSLVKLFYLEDYYLKSKKRYDSLGEFLYSNPQQFRIQWKFSLPRFSMQKYKIFQRNETDSILTEIKTLYKSILKNQKLINEMVEITNDNFP